MSKVYGITRKEARKCALCGEPLWLPYKCPSRVNERGRLLGYEKIHRIVDGKPVCYGQCRKVRHHGRTAQT